MMLEHFETEFLETIRPLLGIWQGVGHGLFPTIESFEYQERIEFRIQDRAEVHYHQKTERRSAPADPWIPSHWEVGFLNPRSATDFVMNNAQSGGRVEVLNGSLDAIGGQLIIRVDSLHLGNDDRMIETARRFRVIGDDLHYTMYMKTTAVDDLALHLEANLKRQNP